MREQWCCGGPAYEMGYNDLGYRMAEHNVADWRKVGAKRILCLDPHDYLTFVDVYPKLFGDDYDFEIVLVVDLVAGADPGGQARAHRPDRPDGHLSRRLPPEQAHGNSRVAPRGAAGDSRPHLQGRRPRHAMVVLLRRGRRPSDRAARPDGGDLPAPNRAGCGARGGHARLRLPLVGAAARGAGEGSRGSRSTT